MVNIKVTDMTCMSCVKKIQTALLKNGVNAKFDIMNQTVSVKENEVLKTISTIKDAGYTPES